MSWLNQEFIYFIISFQWYHRAIAWSLFLYKQMQACWYFNKNIRRSSTEWLSAVAGNENFGYWYYCFSFIYYQVYHVFCEGNFIMYFVREILSCILWGKFYHVFCEGNFIMYFVRELLSCDLWGNFIMYIVRGNFIMYFVILILLCVL